MGKIVVLGSLNTDMVITTDRLPRVGETIMGKNVNYMLGGKGANQAVAAARMESSVALAGKVGADTFGTKLLKNLAQEALDLEAVVQEKNMFTGIASIFKLPEDNCITVIPGANELVDEAYLAEITPLIEAADVLLLQLEIPIATVINALKIAREANTCTILNPAPYDAQIVPHLHLADYITPNETEFEAICQQSLTDDQAFDEAMLAWQTAHTTKLLVTRGSRGSSFVEDGQVVTLPTIGVQVTDTTGAGDTFNGILAVLLSEGQPLSVAVRAAGIGASLSVEKFGAQAGMPTRAELDAALARVPK